ncbi:hypothetical protein Cni_G13902 [Canna indica]|uniref:Hexosyltransferase n=1 Tax=Canna indica TaxID=4628 RepID=A0AAQ3QD45_9LILI|nr:hypothetical protein Cni_G13902 [Canna indica]
MYTEVGRREAYAMILHSAEQYVCGAIAAAKSIRLAGSARDLVILVDETISDRDRSGLEAAKWKVLTILRIRNPKVKCDAYNEWNYSKFRLWQLTDYDNIIFIDADLHVLRNIDFLFTMSEIRAIGNNATLFNSSVMVIEPSNCTFQLLMDHLEEITSYNGGNRYPCATETRVNLVEDIEGIAAEDASRSMNEELAGSPLNNAAPTESRGIASSAAQRVADVEDKASEVAHGAWRSAKDTASKAAKYVSNKADQMPESISDVNAETIERAMNTKN